MNFTFRSLALSLSTILLLTFGASEALAHDEGHGEQSRRIKIIACDGGEVTELTADDLALGETRDIDTSCGKVVSITRTLEDELQVAIDGKVINVPGAGIAIEEIGEDGDGVVRRKVIVRKHGGDCEEGEDCQPQHRVRKIIIDSDGSGDLDARLMSLIDGDLLADCEENDEDCSSRILHVLEDGDVEVESDGDNVVIIKKRIRTEEDEDGNGGE